MSKKQLQDAQRVAEWIMRETGLVIRITETPQSKPHTRFDISINNTARGMKHQTVQELNRYVRGWWDAVISIQQGYVTIRDGKV